MKLKKLLNIIFGRLFIFGLAILVQVAWLLLSLYSLGDASIVVNIFLTLLSLLVVIYIINGRSKPEVKLAWVVPILALPILGGALFLISGGKGPKRKLARVIEAQHSRFAPALPDSEAQLRQLGDPDLAGQSRYLARKDFPLYANTQSDYYALGDDGFPVLMAELEKAEKFIFMEYFIIQPGQMWDSILDVLVRKAKQGVDVRVLYDDVGSVGKVPYHYWKKLEAKGIQAATFNPFIPFYSTVMNNRDHRKITVIDGNVAFTGGINFADEYINAVERFGHWKDNIIRLTGDGVFGLTLLFLEQWNAVRGGGDDPEQFRPSVRVDGDGFVQPYGDTPLDDEYLGENVYLNIINQARDYVYFMTPYLIIDTEIQTALCLAAKRGVDVRIITPGIPDKKMVWDLTRSYYPELLMAGVRIYEYTPGFLHSKICVCDDKLAVVGTINLDYRSLYLHFENACLFFGGKIVGQVKDDFLETQGKSGRIRAADVERRTRTRTLIHDIYYAILRLIAPLL
ncbi:MAG: cardiolipin synthase [Oscillospiraceae bacterium]|jgi:cardiolipin synthase|nr:cardiolipin synthase [Oscillospiraceae bacterium]